MNVSKKWLTPAAAGIALAAGVAWWWPADAPPDEAAAKAAAPSAAASAWLNAGLAAPELAASGAEASASAPQLLGGSVEALAQLPPAQAARALKACYLADSCRAPGVAPDDSLSTHFAVAKAISERIKALPAEGNTAELGALAREFLAFPDGHVQAAALALAARLPADTATANAAVAALADSYDEQLFRKALPVLQQWQAQGLASGQDDMLVATLRTGGVHAAQVVAENLQPFLNDANFSRYEAVLAGMPAGARQSALRQSLRDYRLLKAGG